MVKYLVQGSRFRTPRLLRSRVSVGLPSKILDNPFLVNFSTLIVKEAPAVVLRILRYLVLYAFMKLRILMLHAPMNTGPSCVLRIWQTFDRHTFWRLA